MARVLFIDALIKPVHLLSVPKLIYYICCYNYNSAHSARPKLASTHLGYFDLLKFGANGEMIKKTPNQTEMLGISKDQCCIRLKYITHQTIGQFHEL